mmetsp:Transcript_10363/g.26394  ORF Transcript_10363/g.26394 Transcript_10363/m.26394 type:complete len:283 (+) Transcript_10363:25-873(+)
MPVTVTRQMQVSAAMASFLEHLASHTGPVHLPATQAEFYVMWQDFQSQHNPEVAPVATSPGTVRFYLRARGVKVDNVGALRWPAAFRMSATAPRALQATRVVLGVRGEDIQDKIEQVVNAIRAQGGTVSMGRLGGQMWSKEDRVKFGRFAQFLGSWPEVFTITGEDLTVNPEYSPSSRPLVWADIQDPPLTPSAGSGRSRSGAEQDRHDRGSEWSVQSGGSHPEDHSERHSPRRGSAEELGFRTASPFSSAPSTGEAYDGVPPVEQGDDSDGWRMHGILRVA